ncbi:hypothetical protein ACEWY4_022318 [Coilia grayii]|uniref:Uncharacterized protein n=1 Tax=Coilia grayii TaxID=363190 RepID=A0ABD1J843_9TELE
MTVSSTFAMFLRELPGWYLWGGIFLPVALLLLLVIAHLQWKLQETEAELLAAPDPRETAYRLCHGNRSSPRRQTRQHVHT